MPRIDDAFYNDNEPFACAWLRALIDAGQIRDGRVDPRPIQALRGEDLVGWRRVHLFAGIGGWDHALDLAGWGDETVWTGSCPCQPFSVAGRGLGALDERHLWPEMLRLVGECRPATIFGEQVASADGRQWLAGVFADLEALGYACAGADLCAAGVGAPHIRQRLYWVAHAEQARKMLRPESRISANDHQAVARAGAAGERNPWGTYDIWDMQDARRRCEPGALPLVDGLSERMDEIGGYGNAIVPQVAATFVRAFMEARLHRPDDPGPLKSRRVTF